ncbi:MAG TPA: FMN-binding protein [Longimicrobiales bacterium]|nr:FMN-binding protein [Longimicrobiales bacterium]
MTGPRQEPAARSTAEDAPSWRLVSTLAVAGALAGLLIVGVFRWAEPRILEYRAGVLISAIDEVLGGPARVQTLYIRGDRLTEEPPPGDTIRAEKLYLGYDDSGRPMGYAIVGAKPGFQDIIQLIFGYDPGSREVLGMRVLESKETPGLGDAIIKDRHFVAEFEGVRTPLRGVKDATGAADEVDMITGATISSRAIVDIINHRLDALGTVIDGHGEVP